MKIKALLAVLAVALSPGLAAAMCDSGHVKTSAQCGNGQIWDANTATCITPVHS